VQPNIVDNFISKELSKEINNYLGTKATINPHGMLNKQLHPLNINLYDDGEEMHTAIKLIIENVKNIFGFSEDEFLIDRWCYQVMREGENFGYQHRFPRRCVGIRQNRDILHYYT
jgi:hypothetical protein